MGGDAIEAELARHLIEIVRTAPSLMRVLRTVRALDLPDWLVMSGAVYQRVLNHLTGRRPDYGIKDYDLGYFDATDISYEAEDMVIRRVAAAFDEPLRSAVDPGSPDEPETACRRNCKPLGHHHLWRVA